MKSAHVRRNPRAWITTVAAVLLIAVAVSVAQEILRPTVVHNVSFTDLAIDGTFTVHQQVLDLEPGAESPVHMHGGPELVLVLDGELTFLLADSGEETVVPAGQTHRIPADTFLQVRNDADAPARFVVTFLLPEGAALTTPR